MNWRVKVLSAVGLLLLVIIVGIQNSEPVTLRFLFWDATVDRLLLFLALFLGGALAGVLFSWLWRRGAAKQG